MADSTWFRRHRTDWNHSPCPRDNIITQTIGLLGAGSASSLRAVKTSLGIVVALTFRVGSFGALSDLPSEIAADGLLRHIKVLSSDEFEGRAPGTQGEERSVDYITAQFKELGLKPGNPDGSYVQVSDEIDPAWDLTGAAQDVQLLLEVGRQVADAEDRPKWKSESEFKARGDALFEARARGVLRSAPATKRQ